MSSFLCFVCHSTVNADTNEDTREKYREVIGMNLCSDSHLCFICCHFLNKMWLFKSICLKRSLEYPVLFSEKGTINLQRSDTQVGILCPEDFCLQHLNSKYHFYNHNENSPIFEENQYVQLHEEMNFGLLPNNVEVQTDDIFDHFNDNLLRSDAGDENFNNEEFLVGISKNTRKDVDEFIFGNDSIESPLDNINKIELTNLEEMNEVNITLTDLNVRSFVETTKNYRNDFVQSQVYYKNNYVDKSQEARHCFGNSQFVEKSNQIVGDNEFVEKSNQIVGDNEFVEKSNRIVSDNEFVEKSNQIVGNNDFVEKSQGYYARENGFIVKEVSNNEFVERTQDITLRNLNKTPELVRNVDYVEKSQEFVVRNNEFAKTPDVLDNDNYENQMSDNRDSETDDEKHSNDDHNEKDSSKSSGSGDVERSVVTKKYVYTKMTLSLEEQKLELDANRKEKKYLEAVFKCYSCAMGFLFKDSYQAHMMRHEESNGEHRCSICCLRFANPAVLRAHRANHSVRYQCTLCGQTVRGRHRDTHTCQGETVTHVPCHLCSRIFPGASHYQQHLKRAHRMTQRSYLCNVCGKTCKNQAAVRTHMITHINKKFTCEICPATFSSPYTLNQHKRKHETMQTELHYCVTCNIGYSSRKSLLAHQRNALAHKEKVYKCPVCDRTCPTLQALHNHTTAVHARSKELFCALCPARYSTRKGLVRHMRSHSNVGTKQLPLCHACGEVFKSSSILKRHLKNVCEKDKLEEELANYYEQ